MAGAKLTLPIRRNFNLSKGGGSQTVTNVQALPPAVEAALAQAYSDFNPFSAAFGAVGGFDPQAGLTGTAGLSAGEQAAIGAATGALETQPSYLTAAQQNLGSLMGGAVDTTALQNQLNLDNLTAGSVDPSLLQNLTGATTDTGALLGTLGFRSEGRDVLQDAVGQRADLAGLTQAANAGIDTSGITSAAGAQTDLQGLLNAAQRATDASNIVAAGNQTVDTSGAANIANQQNAATGLLTGLAGQSTNPFLQQQLANSIEGAVNKATSQYALGGRLGSDSFAGALGAGITNAALPALSQNLQQDQARQLQAAQALGSVSGQDIGRQLAAAELGVNAQQADINRALQAAQSAAGIQQADLARGLQGATSAAGLQQADLGRALTGATTAAQVGQADLARQLSGQGQLVDAANAGIARDVQLGGLLADASARDLARDTASAQSLVDVNQADLSRQLQAAGALGDLQTSDAARALQAEQTSRQIDATLANQLAAASEADARARLGAIGQAPGLLGADQALISQAAQLGGLERGIAQAQLDALAAQQAQQNVLDQNQINALLSASGMGSGLFGQTTTQSGGGPSALQSGLGGALTGASLGGLLPAVGGPLGAAIGGGLGLLGIL